jgi:hypothetical protein
MRVAMNPESFLARLHVIPKLINTDTVYYKLSCCLQHGLEKPKLFIVLWFFPEDIPLLPTCLHLSTADRTPFTLDWRIALNWRITLNWRIILQILQTESKQDSLLHNILTAKGS